MNDFGWPSHLLSGHEVFTHLMCGFKDINTHAIILGCKQLTMQGPLLWGSHRNAVTQHLYGTPCAAAPIAFWRERLQELQKLYGYTIASSSVWNAISNTFCKAWVYASHWYVVFFLLPLLSYMRFTHTLQCRWTWWMMRCCIGWMDYHHIHRKQVDCLGRKQPAALS